MAADVAADNPASTVVVERLVSTCRMRHFGPAGVSGDVRLFWRSVVALTSSVVCTLSLALSATAGLAQTVAQPDQLALGLIVKLKDTQVKSVVRLPASVRPSDSAQAQRLRMAAAANRKRVSYLVQKPTAYGANVIHQGYYTTVADAEAEAAKLRLDPDVEWVVVNRMEKQATTSLAFSYAVSSAYPSHKWMQRRVTGGTGVGLDVGVGPGVADFRTAWDRLYNSAKPLASVVVAVLDTGKLSHPDLDGRLLTTGYDFVSEVEFARDGNSLDADPTDPGDYLLQTEINANPALYGSGCTAHNSTWHGTSVMSMLTPLVSSSGANSMGPGALSMLPPSIGKVLPVRIGGTCGALVSDIIEGMLWAAGVDYQGSPTLNQNPARVINLSFGSSGNCQNSDPSSGDSLYRQTVSTLRTRGTLVVASAGNGNGAVGYVGPTRPASCSGVMAVTALRYDGSKAYYANTVDGTQSAGYYGLAVAGGDDQVTPQQENLNLLTDGGLTTSTGVALESSCPSGTCYVSEGTSFAAPQVAAVAALVLAVAPTLTVGELVDALLSTATAYSNGGTCNASTTGHCTCTNTTCGAGVLNADGAMAYAIAHASTGTFSSPALYASYFVPDRLQSSSSKSGGGGAVDDASLLGLLLGVLGLAGWRRFHHAKCASVVMADIR
jgi:serine protease